MFRLIAFLFMLSFSWLFSAEGGEGGGEDSGEGSDEGGEGSGAAPELKHSDADVDKYKGDARREARQAAINELLTKAEGAASVDDLVAAWEEKRTVEEATRSDAERWEGEATKAGERATKAEQERDQMLKDVRLEGALRAAGVSQERLEDALALAERTTEYANLVIGEGRKVEGLEKVVKATVEPRPWLKEASNGAPPRRGVDTSKGGPVDPDVAPGLDRLRAAYG